MLSVPTPEEIARRDRSLPFYFIVDNRTETPDIAMNYEPDTEKGKHWHVVVVVANLDDPHNHVSDSVVVVAKTPLMTVKVSPDVYDRIQRGPADHSMNLSLKREDDRFDETGIVVGRGFLPKIQRLDDWYYTDENLESDMDEAWMTACELAGHKNPLTCGWLSKDKPCSKGRQYYLREQAVIKLARVALESKRLSIMEMMEVVNGVPKELRRSLTLYGQGITGMYRKMAEYLERETFYFEPWHALEDAMDQKNPLEEEGTVAKRARMEEQ
tara:strand:+ start:123 stop:932 length:810 start_codon:yes stop_codon:yes gene_type:complete